MRKVPNLGAMKGKKEDTPSVDALAVMSPKARDRRDSEESKEAGRLKAMLRRGGSMQSLLSLGSRRSNRSGGSSGGMGLPSKAHMIAGSFACVILSWVGTVSILLMIVALRYTGPVVDLARERYVVSATERVGSEAAQVFGAASAARHALDYAVQRQLYFEPEDYDGLSLALEPVFAARKPLRAVDITFDTRKVSVSLRRIVGAGFDRLLVQSDADDCFEKLGRFGCLDGARFHDMDWYQIGSSLPGGQEVDNTTDPPMSSQWNVGPGFVPHVEGGLVESARAVAWSPAHSLIFQSVFPGSYGNLSVIARAVVEVTDLAEDDRLEDEANLGEVGAVYVCDIKGTLLATYYPGEKARIESPTGVTHFRMIWELEGWASSVQQGHFEEARREGIASFRAEPGNLHVAIRAVRGYNHFFVVAGSERSAYADAFMELICTIAQSIVVSPYPATAIILGICFILIQLNARRKRRRVQPEERLAQAEKSLAMLRSRTIRSR